jgi:myo-inositol-1-phosphate synthase
MRFILHDDEGVPLRKFWSRDVAEKFLMDGYTIVELKREKRKRISKGSHIQQLIAEVGEAPF